jgi:hypothetical protein
MVRAEIVGMEMGRGPKGHSTGKDFSISSGMERHVRKATLMDTYLQRGVQLIFSRCKLSAVRPLTYL